MHCLSVKDAELYKLGHISSFHYLNQSNTHDLEGTNNEDEYWKTKRAMDIVGISREDQVPKMMLTRLNVTWKMSLSENRCIVLLLCSYVSIFQKMSLYLYLLRTLYFGHWQPFFILAILSLSQEKMLILQKLRIQPQIFISKQQLNYLCMFFVCISYHDIFLRKYSFVIFVVSLELCFLYWGFIENVWFEMFWRCSSKWLK